MYSKPEFSIQTSGLNQLVRIQESEEKHFRLVERAS